MHAGNPVLTVDAMDARNAMHTRVEMRARDFVDALRRMRAGNLMLARSLMLALDL